MKQNRRQFIFYLFTPIVLGSLIGLITSMGSSYQTFIKPPFAPPGIVFPIVWSILYFLMGISAYIIATSHSPHKKQALRTYYLQLFLNLLWPVLFFMLNLKIVAFVELIILIYVITNMIMQFYKINRKAAYLQIPYLIWCLFASYLNLAITLLNH